MNMKNIRTSRTKQMKNLILKLTNFKTSIIWNVSKTQQCLELHGQIWEESIKILKLMRFLRKIRRQTQIITLLWQMKINAQHFHGFFWCVEHNNVGVILQIHHCHLEPFEMDRIVQNNQTLQIYMNNVSHFYKQNLRVLLPWQWRRCLTLY